MMKKRIYSIIILCILSSILYGQVESTKTSYHRELKVGIRIQKAQKLYWENGFSLDYTCDRLIKKRIHVGLSYVTSRLGSTLNSNAIKQDNYLFNAAYHFRHTKALQLYGRLNLGYFYANMEEEMFKVLPHKAFLISLDGGLYYNFNFPLSISASVGYNLNHGNGISGPGTLFPVFYQMSLFYKIYSE